MTFRMMTSRSVFLNHSEATLNLLTHSHRFVFIILWVCVLEKFSQGLSLMHSSFKCPGIRGRLSSSVHISAWTAGYCCSWLYLPNFWSCTMMKKTCPIWTNTCYCSCLCLLNCSFWNYLRFQFIFVSNNFRHKYLYLQDERKRYTHKFYSIPDLELLGS